MARYSYSKISTFEKCPYNYKLKYIDKIKPDYEMSIEAFMGGIVHRCLEELYKRIQTKRSVSKQGMIRLYNTLWDDEFSKDILIVNGNGPEEYKKKGENFLVTHYDKYYPFNQFEIIGLETEDVMVLPDGSEWYVRIDKFAKDKDGNYYVIDYKTNGKLKDRNEIEEDKQLSMYSVWVYNNFKDAKSVKLVWNMLAFGEEIVSQRNSEELKKLVEEVIVKISKIENTKVFPAKVSPLCRYCSYQNSCEFYQKSKK